MKSVWAIFKREFAAYFATPLAYVFIVIFLFTMGAFTFYIGRFYESDIADLDIFFSYQPWLYLFFIPAIAMRLWAEERRTGTMELLLTLPVPLWATVWANSWPHGLSRVWRWRSPFRSGLPSTISEIPTTA